MGLYLVVHNNYMGVSENVVYPIVPNGFADPYPYEKWLFHWEYTQHFQTNPYGNITTNQPDGTTLLHFGEVSSPNIHYHIFIGLRFWMTQRKDGWPFFGGKNSLRSAGSTDRLATQFFKIWDLTMAMNFSGT